MKRQPLHMLLLALFAFLFTHCTMEKRLYNRGYHIEHKRKLQTNKAGELTGSDEVYKNPVLDAATNPVLSEDEFLAPETGETREVQDSTVVLAPDKIAKDTVYIYDDYEDNIRRKERRLFFTGVPMLGTGLIAASLLSTATAAGANFFEFVVIGAIGWCFAAIAGLLLLTFIIFLCIPANPATERIMPNEQTPGEKTNLSKGENAGLIVCLVVFGIIGLAFLIGGL